MERTQSLKFGSRPTPPHQANPPPKKINIQSGWIIRPQHSTSLFPVYPSVPPPQLKLMSAGLKPSSPVRPGNKKHGTCEETSECSQTSLTNLAFQSCFAWKIEKISHTFCAHVHIQCSETRHLGYMSKIVETQITKVWLHMDGKKHKHTDIYIYIQYIYIASKFHWIH